MSLNTLYCLSRYRHDLGETSYEVKTPVSRKYHFHLRLRPVPTLLALERGDLVVGTPERRVVPVGRDRKQLVGAAIGAIEIS